MRKFLFLYSALLLFVMPIKAQSVSDFVIRGSVYEAGTDLPLSVVSVRALQSKRTVQTHSDGSFSINLNRFPDTLVISSLGFEPITWAINRSPVHADIPRFFLRPASIGLQEVVVNTGYQQTRPNEINGSVAVIDQQTLNQQTGTDILQRLVGVTSGLQLNTGRSNNNPQNETNISIRGLSTINGPLDPLIVLDNFIYEGDLANINPNDVENVTVLKDAAAASIWGARAGNGVIVITTKKGRYNQPMRVSFNSTFTMSEKPNLNAADQMTPTDFIDVEHMLFNRGYFNNVKLYTAMTPALEVFRKRKLGLITSADSASQINLLKASDSRAEYSRHFYTSPRTQQYSLNLQGGSSNHSYTFSTSYDKSTGETYGKSNKLNIRASQQLQPVKNLHTEVGVYYTKSDGTVGRPSLNAIRLGSRSHPYLRLTDDDGQPIPLSLTYSSLYTDTAGGGRLLDWNYYPLDYQSTQTNNSTEELYATAGVKYRFASYLNAEVRYQYQNQKSEYVLNNSQDSYYARNLINSYSQLDQATGRVTYVVPLGGIRTSENSNRNSYTLRGQLNGDHSWGEHRLMMLAGAEARQARSSGDGNMWYGYQPDPLTYTRIDPVSRFRNLVTGSQSTLPFSSSLSKKVNRFVSLYGNGSWLYKKRYSLSGSMRKDGSNIFGLSTNDKWKPLWSVGAGWDLSEEPFYKIKWLPFLKFSTTLGYSGNVDLSRTALAVAAYATDAWSGLPAARINTINNPSLKWEQSRHINFRMNFATAKSVISGSIEYYLKKGTDLYGETPYDYTTFGRSSTIVKNVADMKGNGVDVVLTSRNMDRTLKWYSTLLFNFNRSVTAAYYRPSAMQTFSLLGDGESITPVIGYPLYGIAAYRWGGLDNEGNPQGYLNGELSTDYRAIASAALMDGSGLVYKGTGTPTHFGSVINTFRWKQLTLAANIGYKLNYWFLKPTISYSNLIQNGQSHSDYSRRWQKAGDEAFTSVPSFVYPANSDRDGFYSASEVNVLRGDHLRLQYIHMSYELPIKRKLPFNSLQLYANFSDLGILWRANDYEIDPDNIGGYPHGRKVAFGIRTNF